MTHIHHRVEIVVPPACWPSQHRRIGNDERDTKPFKAGQLRVIHQLFVVNSFDWRRQTKWGGRQVRGGEKL
jgi:hypothetical protein